MVQPTGNHRGPTGGARPNEVTANATSLPSASPPSLHRYRAIFLSDVHLGTRGCQAERLLEFLKHHEADHLYLLGDIVDFWAMRRGIHWSPAQNTVIQKVLRRARHGVQVMLIPGNHDEALREYVGTALGDIRIVDEHVHVGADGRRYLLTHGDQFDQVTRHHRWVAVLGDISYNFLVHANAWLSRCRRRLGIAGYWSLASYAKRKVKTAVNFIFDFEDSVIHAVRDRGLDGVICGHIHSASLRQAEAVTYVNCGDWVDSCSAAVEHFDGRIEIIVFGPAQVTPAAIADRQVPAAGAGRPVPQPAGGHLAPIGRVDGSQRDCRHPEAGDPERSQAAVA